MEPLQAGDHALREPELIILYSACYCHDIGMQYENAGITEPILRLQLPQPWEELSESTRRDLLRQYHNEISADMVMCSVRSEAPPIGLQLTPDYYPARLAALCEAHTVHTELPRYQELTQDGPNLRTALLSGLLWTADILDESQHRAKRERARTLSLDIVSQTHWWRHYYTEAVTIEQVEKEVRLWFDFPKARREDYSRIVPQLQMPWIEEEFGRHMAVFHRNGLGWTVWSRIEYKPFSDAEVMPDAVEAEMLKQLDRRRRSEQEKHRQIALQQFAEARPHIDRRLRALESRMGSLSTDAYLRELSNIAQDLSELGGRRSAWNMLSAPFQQGAAALEPAERLQIGMRLAAMLAQDNEAGRAVQVLRDLLPLADQLPDHDPEKVSFWKLWARCLTEAGDYHQATTAIERAAELALDESIKADLQAQQAELHLLIGEIDAALASSAPGEGVP